MIHDLKFALRQLAKAPGFTAVVIFTLALGIGACTTVFSIIDSVLLPASPLLSKSQAARNVYIRETRGGDAHRSVMPSTFLVCEQHAQSFEFLGAGVSTTLTLTEAAEPVQLAVIRVTERYFEFHGARPHLGRAFASEEFTPGNEKVVILRHPAWQRLLGADPGAIGRTLQINGESYTVVGVLPREFERTSEVVGDAVMPLVFTERDATARGGLRHAVYGRLKPNVTLTQARAEMDVLTTQIAEQFPGTDKRWRLVLKTATEMRSRDWRSTLWMLLGAVGCVLLIACANVGNLLLARATTRQREMSVRAAMGASRAQILRQLLTESIVLALLGGAAGTLLATWLLEAVRGYAGAYTRELQFVELNPGMLAFALGLSVATGIIFGIAPAWLASNVDLNTSLKQGAPGSGGQGVRSRLRSGLIIFEVAAALVLLAASGAFIRLFIARAGFNHGLAPERAAVLSLNISPGKYATSAQRLAFVDDVLHRIRALPDVEAAGAANQMPAYRGAGRQAPSRLVVEGRARPNEWPIFSETPGARVTPGFFQAMGIPVRRGREFTDYDMAQKTPVVLINEWLANQYFPGEDPIGRRIGALLEGNDAPREWMEIIGVVGDVVLGNPGEPVGPQVYQKFAQSVFTQIDFIVRTTRDPAGILSSLKPQVWAIDKDAPVRAVGLLRDFLDNAEGFAVQRLPLHLLTAFAGIALVLAAVGIYSVVAFSVAQRTPEIGIRMALGAQRSDVLRLVLFHGGRVAGAGMAVGLVAALASGRIIEAMLYRANPRDPVTLALIVLLLAVVATLACWLPARRATKIDPIVALRAE